MGHLVFIKSPSTYFCYNPAVYILIIVKFATMVQNVIIAVVFLLALFYIGRMFYRQLFVKKGCGENCKCGVDFSNIGPDK